MALTTALVTGASSGIGYEISKVLAEEGHDLVLVARREERLKQLAQYLEKDFNISVTVIAADLTKTSEIDRIFDYLKEQSIPVDILVNNAGLGSWGPLTADDRNTEIQQIQVNVLAAQNAVVVAVLDLRNLLRQVPRGVVEDHAQHRHHRRLGVSPLLLDQRRADQVPHRLRAVRVAVVGHPRVELLQQVLVDRQRRPR